VITIARLTIGEAARRRVLWVLVGLSILSVVLVAWGVDRLVSLIREQGAPELQTKIVVSQILIFIAFMFTFVLAMTAAFLGAPAIATDLESGIAQAMLARPLRRSSYLLGRWLGLSIVVAGYAILSGFLAIEAAAFVSGYTPPNLILPIGYLAYQAIVLMTLALALSTRLAPIAGGAICVVAYGLAWMSGVLGDIGTALHAGGVSLIGDIGKIVLPTDGLWRGVVYGLEPSIVISQLGGTEAAQANPFFAAEPPSQAFLAWAVVWLALVLLVAINQLRRREL
jgi:ABC-2 family transporter protein